MAWLRIQGFDSTYEGLKPRTYRYSASGPLRFDSTYEGLKQGRGFIGGLGEFVSTVPMRA